jgi:hypothetical protein
MDILCPVSLGELLDKISILRIKQQRIQDPAKLQHIGVELDRLTRAAGDLTPYARFLDEFQKVNEALWEIEDAIRLKEKAKEFDEEFVRLARSVYRTNDKRFEIKNEVNRQFGSAIQEQKSYEKY